jgi:hypothetical protein
MAGDAGSSVVVTKPRANVYTALLVIATVFLLAATYVLYRTYDEFYGLEPLL